MQCHLLNKVHRAGRETRARCPADEERKKQKNEKSRNVVASSFDRKYLERTVRGFSILFPLFSLRPFEGDAELIRGRVNVARN